MWGFLNFRCWMFYFSNLFSVCSCSWSGISPSPSFKNYRITMISKFFPPAVSSLLISTVLDIYNYRPACPAAIKCFILVDSLAWIWPNFCLQVVYPLVGGLDTCDFLNFLPRLVSSSLMSLLISNEKQGATLHSSFYSSPPIHQQNLWLYFQTISTFSPLLYTVQHLIETILISSDLQSWPSRSPCFHYWKSVWC